MSSRTTRKFFAVLLLSVSACREGPAEFDAEQPEVVSDSGGRITLNVRDDRIPSWNGTSDSIFFAAESYPPYRTTKGLLLAISRRGGVVRPLVEAVQSGALFQPWLSAPAISPDRNQIAFIEVTDTVERQIRATTVRTGEEALLCPSDADIAVSEPVLRSGRLRVRDIKGGAPDRAALAVKFEGVSEDSTQHPFDLHFVTIEIAYPFQRQFEQHRSAFFRPAWSPDGTRIAFSDGLSIRVWTIGQPQSVPLPGSDDGIFPAWSPDGNRIAFTRLARGPARTFDCIHFFREFVVGFHRRTVYGTPIRSGTIIVTNVDGSAVVTLGEGYAPTWTPDGRQLIASRAGSLWRLPIDGSAPVDLPGTAIGFEPAVSPDGNWLAFVREDAGTEGNDPSGRAASDIWLVRLR